MDRQEKTILDKNKSFAFNIENPFQVANELLLEGGIVIFVEVVDLVGVGRVNILTQATSILEELQIVISENPSLLAHILSFFEDLTVL